MEHISNNPTVSIILPVYNAEAFLDVTLQNLRNQIYSNLMILCINDGSTDSSQEILERHAVEDSRIVVFTQDNTGPAGARNAGLDIVLKSEDPCEYIMILDADDIFEPDMIERMVCRAEATQADVVVCNSDEFGDNTPHARRETPWVLNQEYLPSAEVFSPADLKGCLFATFMGWPWDKLYRTEYLKELDIRFPDMPNSEDLYFVFLSLVRAQRISAITDKLIHHRVARSGSVSTSRESNPRCFYDAIELLKSELQTDPEKYTQYEWGFLGWAMDYTIWNIATHPADSPVRAELLASLMEGGMPALELDTHVPRFYGVYRDTASDLECLRAEYYSKKPRRSKRDFATDVWHAINRPYPLQR